MNPSYILFLLLVLLLTVVLLSIYYRLALRFALQVIDPQRMNYGAVLRQEMERITDRSSDRQKWAQQFREFSNMTELDRRAVVTLIQSIRIISKTELKITFRYQMEYEAALQKLSQARLEQEAV